MGELENLKIVFENSARFAKSVGANKIETEHLLFGVILAESSYASKALKELGINKDNYRKFIYSCLKNKNVIEVNEVGNSKSVALIFAKVKDFSQKNASKLKNIEFLLLEIIQNEKFKATKILKSVYKISVEKLAIKLRDYIGLEDQNEKITINSVTKKVTCKTKTQLPEELLALGYDLTEKVKSNPEMKIIGRDKETSRVIEILCRKTKNNPVLIGEPGVGKSSVVEGLALRINCGDVPSVIENKTIFSLDLASLMAGTKFRGSMEQKLKNAISLIQERGDIIVFIDEIHMLAEAGSKDGEISPADILKPYLARGEFQTIGATTLDEYKKYIEKDPALERRFQPVGVEEPTKEDTIKILQGVKSSYENYHGVAISDEAIESAVTLSIRYISNRFLPDKAIDLIDEACSKARVNASAVPDNIKILSRELAKLETQKEEYIKIEDYINAKIINDQKLLIEEQIDQIKEETLLKTGKGVCEITAENIRDVVSSWTKIPVNKLSSSEREKLLNLEKLIGEKVIGQPEAVSVVASAIRRARADINDPNRPLGSFLFLGPTGVGKTELTKAVADVLFDSEDSIIRFDMSEFMESHSLARLIGAPPGYVGFENGGELTEAVKKKPYSIVLFDEIEKAHPDIFNILLQIFDEGRLTDSAGKHINFKNTLIVLTSNNGVQDLIARRKYEKLNPSEVKVSTDEYLMDKLRDKFRPELLNRIDSIVIFDSLDKASLVKIADIMLASLKKNLARSRNISLDITSKAKELVAELGYDEAYGARPLRRVIDKQLRDKLAQMIMNGEIQNNSAVRIDAVSNKFTFEILC